MQEGQEGRQSRPGERSVQRRSRKPSTATENGACSAEGANLPRLRSAPAGDGGERGYGAEPHRESQASKPPSFHQKAPAGAGALGR